MTQKPTHVTNLRVEEGNVCHILGEPFKIFSKYVKVFDLYFVATPSCSNDKVLHGASVLYQYIDNDDDGHPDNQLVYFHLVQLKATMVMFCDEGEHRRNKRFYRDNERCLDAVVQDLQAEETRPGCLMPYEFDASLEECFHLVTEGYMAAYPDVFGPNPESAVGSMLDCARGGYFKKVPKRYPEHAWFTYYDKSCDYEGMLAEYLYWAMTTILGGQQHRRMEIEDEWRHCTCSELESGDNEVFKLLTNPMYKFPTKLPLPLDCVPLHQVTGRGRPSSSDSDSDTGSSSDSSSSEEDRRR